MGSLPRLVRADRAAEQEADVVQVDGFVEPGFEPVRDAFATNFELNGELGAACAATVRGRLVVDLFGGTADAVGERPWQEDTVQLVFSTTKAATAVCALLLAERGDLDLDAPVVDYWPQFGAHGKERVPVRWLLSHRSGLPVVDAPLTRDDLLAWEPVVAALAAQRPLWEPGSTHGYHALTYGWLVGEVVRRVSGRSLGRFFAEEVAEPLGLDFWIGLPEQEEHRVGRLVQLDRSGPEVDLESLPPPVREIVAAYLDPTSLTRRALMLCDPPLDYDDPVVHRAEVPAANGICTARSLARLYAALLGEVDGIRLLRPETLAEATAPQSEGVDKVLLVPTRFGLGFMLPSVITPLFGPNGFGHFGAGGSVGFADPDAGIAFAYVTNRLQTSLLGDARTGALVDALRGCL